MPLDFSAQEPDYNVLLSAIRRAEGGDKAKKPYGVLSVPVKNEAEARQVALNTAKNSYSRWNAAGQPGNYINFLADRYVPAKDDPQGNINWKKNVPAIYAQLSAKKPAPTEEPTLDPLLLRPLPPVNYPVLPFYPALKR